MIVQRENHEWCVEKWTRWDWKITNLRIWNENFVVVNGNQCFNEIQHGKLCDSLNLLIKNNN